MAYLASVFALFLLVVYWTHSGLGSVALTTTTANVSEPTAAVSVAQPSPTVWTHPVPATAAPMPAAAVPGHRVALVLYGVRFNGLAAFSDRVGAALRRYVAQALNADVFVCGANVDGTEAMVRSSMQGAAIVDVHLREEPDDAHMLEAFRSSPSGAWFARLLGDALPAAVDALQEARWIELAYGRVEAYERAHSIRYEWIHFQRPDLEWFAPHPPLELLERTRLYVPTRRADALPPGSLLCPRDACARFAQFHSLLLNGTVASAMVNEQGFFFFFPLWCYDSLTLANVQRRAHHPARWTACKWLIYGWCTSRSVCIATWPPPCVCAVSAPRAASATRSTAGPGRSMCTTRRQTISSPPRP